MVDKKENKKKIIEAMSMDEFKAWLDGFSECFKNGSPNKSQWNRIEERLALVSAYTKIEYRERPYWWPHWYFNQFTSTTPIYGGIGLSGNGISYNGNVDANYQGMSYTIDNVNISTILLSAATEIGKSEALNFVN